MSQPVYLCTESLTCRIIGLDISYIPYPCSCCYVMQLFKCITQLRDKMEGLRNPEECC